MLAIVRGHAGELLRFARRFSLGPDDAQDAYQRALEILVRRLRESSVDNPLSYLRTIIRHEAFQVRVERERTMTRAEVDVEERRADPAQDPAEHVERFERLTQTAEALKRLKPQELTALTLRAEGLSYREICERMGWTYTRANRCISEGRRALLTRLRAIESGAECERWLPLLSAFADGEASAREVTELRPHLRSCGACRATLRSLHQAPGRLRAIVPPELLLPAAAAAAHGGGAGGHLEALVHGALDKLTASALRFQGALDALPGAKVAAVAASTVAVAGGGAAIEHAAKTPRAADRPAPVEQRAEGATTGDAASVVTISQPAGGPATAGQPSAGAGLLATAPASTGPEWPRGGAGSRDAAAGGEFGFEHRDGSAPVAGGGAGEAAAARSPLDPAAPSGADGPSEEWEAVSPSAHRDGAGPEPFAGRPSGRGATGEPADGARPTASSADSARPTAESGVPGTVPGDGAAAPRPPAQPRRSPAPTPPPAPSAGSAPSAEFGGAGEF